MAIASPQYDLAARTVRLTLSQAVSASKAHRVIAVGHGPRTLTDNSGRKIDGRGTGGTGTDFTGKSGAMSGKV